VIALALAATAWITSHDPSRFLAVIVVATPCPLLIAIPVAVIGAISLSAARGVIIKNPAALEQITGCRTLVFDKTGTLTYGRPSLTQVVTGDALSEDEALRLAASVEQYSKHPLAGAIVREASRRRLAVPIADHVSEKPGDGLRGAVAGRDVRITGRHTLELRAVTLPPAEAGLECVVIVDDRYAALFRFHDAPRVEAKSFVSHLRPRHGVGRIMLVSGDRPPEVEYLARTVGITDVHAGKSPEDKLALVTAEAARGPVLFVGDGINDAPAMLAATVGVAFGRHSDITTEAADAVIMEPSLARVDELIHIARRMRRIALESAIGGMTLSGVGMLLAAFGYLPPLAGAIAQEVIDLLAVINAVRVAIPREPLRDF
jgi:heavy metal translocating P-type ATPase